jgi:LemA protein
LDEGVDSAWAQVENVYQRRSDLIRNLVATVQGAADFEQETLLAVTEARSSATSMTFENAPTPEQLLPSPDPTMGFRGHIRFFTV